MTKSVHVSHKGLKRTAIILMADFLSLLNVTIISLKEEETKALYFSMAFFFWGGGGVEVQTQQYSVYSVRHVNFPIGILGQMWNWTVSIPDLCTLSYLSLTDVHNTVAMNSLQAKCKLRMDRVDQN